MNGSFIALERLLYGAKIVPNCTDLPYIEIQKICNFMRNPLFQAVFTGFYKHLWEVIKIFPSIKINKK